MTSLLRLRAGLPQVVRKGGRSLRIAHWPGRARTAQLGPVPGEAPPTGDLVRAAVDDLGELGFDRVLTIALAPADQAPFRAAGLDEQDRLVLLRHELAPLPAPVAHACVPRLRTARRGEWGALADLDGRAFPGPWHLDLPGITDSLTATPWARIRAAGTPALGYAVVGRSRDVGYLQRLAVEPTAQGRGIGTALTVDALAWCRAKGGLEVVVNTQESNTRALALYLRLGFRELPERLAVLGRPLGPG